MSAQLLQPSGALHKAPASVLASPNPTKLRCIQTAEDKEEKQLPQHKRPQFPVICFADKLSGFYPWRRNQWEAHLPAPSAEFASFRPTGIPTRGSQLPESLPALARAQGPHLQSAQASAAARARDVSYDSPADPHGRVRAQDRPPQPCTYKLSARRPLLASMQRPCQRGERPATGKRRQPGPSQLPVSPQLAPAALAPRPQAAPATYRHLHLVPAAERAHIAAQAAAAAC